MHDRKPRAVIQCMDAADVMAAVAAGRDGGFDLAIRGGGPQRSRIRHGGRPGHRPVADEERSGRPGQEGRPVGGGATWGDVDHATYPFGLAAPGGIISTTGVGGLTLGGGIGYLTRGVGLSIDNLLSADVVLADGRQVTASDYQNEDLFWALRGGGGNSVSSPASSFSCTRLVTSWAARCSTSSTMPPRSWRATANSSPMRPNSSDAFRLADRSSCVCRGPSRISFLCWSLLERPHEEAEYSGHYATWPK